MAPTVVHEVTRAPLRLEHLVDAPGGAGLVRTGEVIEEPALGAAPQPVGIAPGELAAHHREVETEGVGAPRPEVQDGLDEDRLDEAGRDGARGAAHLVERVPADRGGRHELAEGCGVVVRPHGDREEQVAVVGVEEPAEGHRKALFATRAVGLGRKAAQG